MGMGIKQKLIEIYDKKYKPLMILSFGIMIVALIILGHSYLTTGEFVQKGVSLKGGITLTISLIEDKDIASFEQQLKASLPDADLSVRKLTEAGKIKEIIIEAADVESEQLLEAVKNAGITITDDNYTLESMGSALGARFFQQTIKAVIIAFIAMALVVFITFRAWVPSMFVILAAVSDILSTLAVISFLDIKLSTAGVAAFLMLIGYSVDTDILLTTRVLKRKEGTIFERILKAMRTGMTMSCTSLIASLIAFYFSKSAVIKQIMLIIAIGMVFDMIYTWIQNAGILRWYLEKKHGKS